MANDIESASGVNHRVKTKNVVHGIRRDAPAFEGLGQYCEPLNFELAGRGLRLALDDGRAVFADFLDGRTFRWAELGTAGTVESYRCVKAGEDIYLVDFTFLHGEPGTDIVIILDLDERLVTLVETAAGGGDNPYGVNSAYTFGAINLPGFPLPEKRPKYTADLLGKRMRWQFTPNVGRIIDCFSTEALRASPPEDGAKEGPCDKPAVYIKIKQGLYLVGFTEQGAFYSGRPEQSYLFLVDTARVKCVGRTFGFIGSKEGKPSLQNELFGAYGEFLSLC